MEPHDPRTERNGRPARGAAWGPALVGVLALAGALHVAAIDASYFLAHVRAMGAPDATGQMLYRLELEIAAESLKLFLDVYLVAVTAMILAPVVSALRGQRGGARAGAEEYAAEMFLARVGSLRSWLIGVVLLRGVIGYLQRSWQLEVEDGSDLVYGGIVLLLLGSALLLSRKHT